MDCPGLLPRRSRRACGLWRRGPGGGALGEDVTEAGGHSPPDNEHTCSESYKNTTSHSSTQTHQERRGCERLCGAGRSQGDVRLFVHHAGMSSHQAAHNTAQHSTTHLTRSHVHAACPLPSPHQTQPPPAPAPAPQVHPCGGPRADGAPKTQPVPSVVQHRQCGSQQCMCVPCVLTASSTTHLA